MLRSRCEVVRRKVVRRDSERIPATSHKSLGHTFRTWQYAHNNLGALIFCLECTYFTTKHRVKLLYNSVARHWFPSLIILLFYMYTVSENGIHYTPLRWLIFTENVAVAARPRGVLRHLKSSLLLYTHYTAETQLRWRTKLPSDAARQSTQNSITGIFHY